MKELYPNLNAPFSPFEIFRGKSPSPRHAIFHKIFALLLFDQFTTRDFVKKKSFLASPCIILVKKWDSFFFYKNIVL